MSRDVSPILGKLSRQPLLSAAEEIALAIRRDEGDRTAVDELVYRNQRLVFKIASRYTSTHAQLDDLISAGQIGLLTAAENFDPSFGTRFGTFAFHWIQVHIQRESYKFHAVHIPTYLRACLTKAKMRRWSIAKASRKFGWSQDRTRRVLHANSVMRKTTTSIGGTSDQYDGFDTMDPAKGPLGIINDAEFKRRLHDRVDSLPPRWAEAVRLAFGLDGGGESDLRKISSVLGVSRERARQLKEKGLAALRSPSHVEPS